MIDDEATEIFSVELDVDTYDALDKKAKLAGMSLDDYCTMILIDAIKTSVLENVVADEMSKLDKLALGVDIAQTDVPSI